MCFSDGLFDRSFAVLILRWIHLSAHQPLPASDRASELPRLVERSLADPLRGCNHLRGRARRNERPRGFFSLMVINSNMAALGSARRLGEVSTSLSKSLARLSSGSRIVSPEDDSAGLAQSITLSSQNRRNNAARTNIQNSISYLQTKDGYARKIQKALDRMS